MHKGAIFNGKTVKEVLHTFGVMWMGWELDSRGWVVLFDDGSKSIIMTNHGQPFVATFDDLEKKINEYGVAINETREAMKFLEAK